MRKKQTNKTLPEIENEGLFWFSSEEFLLNDTKWSNRDEECIVIVTTLSQIKISKIGRRWIAMENSITRTVTVKIVWPTLNWHLTEYQWLASIRKEA